MIRRLSIAAIFCGLLLGVGANLPAQNQEADTAANGDPSRVVPEVAVVGAIGPATSRYVSNELDAAAAADAPLLILRLDTPGGLDGAMREIIQAILGSPVPVVAYVGPSGARAASAGTYILYASHIAAMAPATNLGAATPVSIGGGMPGGEEPSDSGDPADKKRESDKKDADEDGQNSEDGAADKQDSPSESDSGSAKTADNATAMRRKVVNDAVAYIRSLAERRDRNADWAERAVREGVSLSAEQALAKNVIEHIANNERALLDAIDGETVETAAGERTLDTSDLVIEARDPDWRTQLLSVITNPTVAYLLFMMGIYGLILEGLNPGAAVPGVIGAISLLFALFAFQLLPINYAGLALIALGIGLMIAEMFAPSFGILGLGGVTAFVFGSIMLMDTDVPGFEIPLGLIGGIAIASALLLFLIIYMFLRSRGERVATGREGLIGSQCVALEDFQREGRVLLHGESWLAECAQAVQRDQRLIVENTQGLKLFVRAEADADQPHRPSQSAGNTPARS